MIDARMAAKAGLLGLAALTLAACATKDGWKGAEAEKAYDAELNSKRLAEGLNNDDYYELMADGRILVFSDAKDFKVWLKTNEIPLAVTKFRAGPNGETVKFALTKNETKAMEKIVGYKGGAQNLYEGNVPGIAKGFFGFVKKADTYYVFDNYNVLMTFKKTGEGTGATETLATGQSAVYVGAASVPKEGSERFAKLFDGK